MLKLPAFTGPTRSMRDGIEATSTVPLGFDRRAIRLFTSARRGKIESSATVVQYAPDGRSFGYVLFQDWQRTILSEVGRGTMGAIHDAHLRAMRALLPLEGEIRAEYGQPALDDGPLLQSHTADDLRARAAALEAPPQAEGAPSDADFRLTGSNRPADLAIAAGQMELPA